jgi:hypothetical protein
MDRSKIVAVLTGAIALLLGVGYLLIVQLLDFRGEMLPAPQSFADQSAAIATLPSTLDHSIFHEQLLLYITPKELLG